MARRGRNEPPHFTILHYKSHVGVVWTGHSAGAGAGNPKAIAELIAMIAEAAGATTEVIAGDLPGGE